MGIGEGNKSEVAGQLWQNQANAATHVFFSACIYVPERARKKNIFELISLVSISIHGFGGFSLLTATIAPRTRRWLLEWSSLSFFSRRFAFSTYSRFSSYACWTSIATSVEKKRSLFNGVFSLINAKVPPAAPLRPRASAAAVRDLQLCSALYRF